MDADEDIRSKVLYVGNCWLEVIPAIDEKKKEKSSSLVSKAKRLFSSAPDDDHVISYGGVFQTHGVIQGVLSDFFEILNYHESPDSQDIFVLGKAPFIRP